MAARAGSTRALDPTAEIRDDVRYVDDGDLITSAGVSAGIEWRCTWSPASPNQRCN